MSWEKLPIDICIYILKIRNEIRNKIIIDKCKIIQNSWRNYILPDTIAYHLALDIEIDQFDNIMVSIPSTHKILKNCIELISGKHKLSFWKIVIQKLEYSLLVNNYDNGNIINWLSPEAVNYRKIKYEYNNLVKKFDLIMQ